MNDFIDRLKSLDIKQEINNLIELIETFYQNYKETNSQKLRLIDTFVVFSFLVFCIQLVYVFFNGLDPMNSFLSGVMACLGTIILLVCLRLHVNPKTKLPTDSPEKIYAEYLIASFILYFVCINFMG
jgi:peptidoglycan/LPS O-acetylase OafA/YrhL